MSPKLSHNIIKILYDILTWYENNKGAGKAAVILNYYNMWQNIHAFSINISKKGWIELRKIAKGININIRKRDDDWRFLFAIETYMHLLVRALTLSKLGKTPQNMDNFIKIISKYRNIFEPSVFEWIFEAYKDSSFPSSLRNKLVQQINVVFSIMYNLNMMTLTFDVFREIYQNILPKEVRRSLGEFYTREEIVDEVLDAAGFDLIAIRELYNKWKSSQINKSEEPVILDPACGSGSFLVRVIKRIFRALGCKPDIAEFIEKTVVGIDINPFAVELAKLNFILTMSDELTKCKATYMPGTIRIYWADSLAILKNAVNTYNAPVYIVQIPSLAQLIGEEQIKIPFFQAFDFLTMIDVVYDAVSKGKTFQQLLYSLSDRIDPKTLMIYRGELQRLFDVIMSIYNNGNHKLIELLKNTTIVASLIGVCNFVLGNPPWVRIHNIAKNLMKVLRKYYKYYSKDSVYDPKFKKTKTPFGKQHDYSIAFVERGLQFLRNSGVLGYVITSKVTKAMYAGKMREDIVENYKILELRDYSLYRRPLFQDAVNYPLIISIKKEKPSKDYKVKIVVFNTIGAKKSFELSQNELPLDKNDLKSPWILAPSNIIKIWRKVSRNSSRLGDVYEIFMGIKTGADELYIVELIGYEHNLAKVKFKNGKIKLIEKQLLHPVVRGKNIDPYTFGYNEYIIFTHDIKTLEPLWDVDQKEVLMYLGLVRQKLKIQSAGSALVYLLSPQDYQKAYRAVNDLTRKGFYVMKVNPCAISVCYEIYKKRDKKNDFILKISFDERKKAVFVEGLRIPGAPKATYHFLDNLNKLIKRDDYKPNLPPWAIFRVSKEKFKNYRIAWQEIAKHFEASILPIYDSEGRLYVPTVKVYFIVEEEVTKAIKLLIYLNSDIASAFLKLRALTDKGGHFEHQSVSVGHVPIPHDLITCNMWKSISMPDKGNDLNLYGKKIQKEYDIILKKELIKALGLTDVEYNSLVNWSKWLNELNE